VSDLEFTKALNSFIKAQFMTVPLSCPNLISSPCNMYRELMYDVTARPTGRRRRDKGDETGSCWEFRPRCPLAVP